MFNLMVFQRLWLAWKAIPAFQKDTSRSGLAIPPPNENQKAAQVM